MELPKNIVQIGIPDKTHKIYVEDYVVSYIKQLNKSCDGKAAGLALYGKMYEEDGCRYYFLYGASRVEGLEHRGPYLSQMEKEEIEDIGRKYFNEYEFLAWCSVKETPVEGFFVQAQGKGVEINGYACFYEKNESMLNYMLMPTSQIKEAAAVQETAHETAPEKRPARGEWSSSDYIKPTEPVTNTAKLPAKKTGYGRVAAASALIVLCVVAITTLNDYEKLEDLQVAARRVVAGFTEQKLPDERAQQTPLPGSIIELQTPSPTDGTEQQTPPPGSIVELQTPSPADGTEQQPPPTEGSAELQTPSPEETPLPTVQPPTAYTIVKGDTLISICMKQYGSLDRMQEVCVLNEISNADSIQIGQTILLP